LSEVRGKFSGSASIERWQLPEVSGPVIELADARRRSDHELRQAQQQAEARGYQAGMERAEAELRTRFAALDERVQRLDALLALMARPLEVLDAEVERELIELALAIGKQLARRELRTEPTQIIAIVRESLAQLPLAAREVRVHLHPEDAQTVRERLAAGSGERAWSVIEDPALTRGGCVVQSEASRIDARLESRIAAIAANALGDERTVERSSAPEAP
jgi:flagellar assembly protein FliH